MVWSIALRGKDDLERFFTLLRQHTKTSTTLAFINADWRDFQNKPAVREIMKNSILVDDYLKILEKTGWQRTHIIQAPLSSERFDAGGCQRHAKEEDPRDNQPVCDNSKPGLIVSRSDFINLTRAWFLDKITSKYY